MSFCLSIQYSQMFRFLFTFNSNINWKRNKPKRELFQYITFFDFKVVAILNDLAYRVFLNMDFLLEMNNNMLCQGFRIADGFF